MKIGVIGTGVVGYPLLKTLEYYHKNVFSFDTEKDSDTWEDIVSTDMVFVCLPTNENKQGRLDTSIIDNCLNDLENSKYKGIVVIKSTLGLGYINDIIKRHSFPIVVFPEWLRALHALPDTLAPEMTVLGVTTKDMDSALKVLKVCCWHTKTDGCIFEPEEAVIIKLTANALAATKISFANQIQIICNEYGINSHCVMDKVRLDPRCSPRYLKPGNPYSGACLPKDTSELMSATKDNHLLKGVVAINDIYKRLESDS